MSEIGPGSGYQLFEELEAWELFPADGDATIMDCGPEEALELADALRMAAPYTWGRKHTPFSFIASSSLHGCASPYWNHERRSSRIRQLSRFAALYADQIVIQDPFAVLDEYPEPLTARIEFTDNLIALRQLRPLIEAGIVVFGPVLLPICESHEAAFERRSADALKLYLKAVDPLRRKFADELTTNIEHLGPEDLVAFAEEEVGHTAADAVAHLGHEGLKDYPSRVELVADLAFRLIVNDLHYSSILGWTSNYSVLTGNRAELAALQRAGANHHAEGNVLEALAHTIPVVEGADIPLLLKLRAEEGEAFQVYREAISKAVREAEGQDAKTIETILADLIRPEVARLDMAVSNARKLATRHVRENLVFGAGLVSVGLGTGLVSPEAQAILGALGGFKFGTEILKGLNQLVSEPAEVRNSNMYFLWRASRAKR